GGVIEAMTVALPDDDASWCDAAVAAARGKAAVAIGPGSGRARGGAIRALVNALDPAQPLVLDADALNAFAPPIGDDAVDGADAGDPRMLAGRRGPTVLTPHPGEMARLLGAASPAAVQADRLAAARRLAHQADAIVVLKGARTVVAAPDGRAAINPTGNPGMATAGSGDALTGIVLALLGQGVDPLTAARAAVYWHGAAGDVARDEHGVEGVRAGDLIDALPRALAAQRARRADGQCG
ncbi:MAG: NAD(P)H-hydrate dehydratase, partial [Acidobacteriota bacterium]